jgi:hypothetical protein
MTDKKTEPKSWGRDSGRPMFLNGANLFPTFYETLADRSRFARNLTN